MLKLKKDCRTVFELFQCALNVDGIAEKNAVWFEPVADGSILSGPDAITKGTNNSGCDSPIIYDRVCASLSPIFSIKMEMVVTPDVLSVSGGRRLPLPLVAEGALLSASSLNSSRVGICAPLDPLSLFLKS